MVASIAGKSEKNNLDNYLGGALERVPFYNWATEGMYCPGDKISDSGGSFLIWTTLLLSTDLAKTDLLLTLSSFIRTYGGAFVGHFITFLFFS